MRTPRLALCLVTACLTGATLLSGLPAGAAPVATETSDAAADTLMLGRKNPFRPLILPNAQQPIAPPSLPAGTLPSLPAARPTTLRHPVAYVGLAYDGAEAIAAVRVNGKVRFVRQGEQVEGATLTRISPKRLIWKKNRKRLVSPLRRHPGAPKP